MEKKIPLRKCIATQEVCPKKELIRVVKNKEGKIFIDLTGKVNGHGAYLKKDIVAIEKTQKSKCLQKVFQCEIPEEIFSELYEIVTRK